jgi:5'-nucleotidase
MTTPGLFRDDSGETLPWRFGQIFCGRRSGALKKTIARSESESSLDGEKVDAREHSSSCPVVTPSPTQWEAKIQKLLDAGKNNAFFVLDFDRTMTRCFLETGAKSLDCHDILGSHVKISWACKRMMEVLMDKFYPIETDPTMSHDEKCKHMVEWYTLVNQLLAQQGLNRDDVAQAVEECKDFRLRPGVEELFQLAHCAGIPIIVLSAGVGNVIEEVIRQRIRKPSGETGEPWENVRVLSNSLLWDDAGKHVGFSEPVLHPFNKSMQDAPKELLDFIGGREFCVLAGDGLGDLTMAQGSGATEVLKLGFLNERIDERLAKYTALDAYDRVVLNDWSFEPLLDVIRGLCTVDATDLSFPSCATPVVTADPRQWARKVARLVEAGKDGLVFIVDFDRTITKCFLENGQRSLDCHDILASGGEISWACKRTMEVLMEKFYPIETDPHMTNEDKSQHMVEWYELVHALLVSQKLTREDVRKAVAECKDFRLRAGVEELFQFAFCHGIPIVVLSAGLGNVIEEVIRQRFRKPDGKTGEPWENVRVLSNTLLWDDEGRHQGFSQPIIQPFNKSLQDAPEDLRSFIEGRHVAIVAGDGMGDVNMAHGHDTTEVLKLGFLNERIDERLATYTGPDAFDRVVLNDGGFEPILEVLRSLK